MADGGENRRSALRGLCARMGWTAPTAVIVAALTVTNAVLVSFHRELFPTLWRHVMWEGGVIETLTVVSFLAAAPLYAWAAARAAPRSARRRWLGLFAVLCLGLVGEETNYGQEMLILDLDAPDFAARYNPQHGTLHNVAPGWVPILLFFVIVATLRFAPRLRRRLALPLPRGFLNAVLVTGIGVLFMRLGQGRHESVDEVYEWSSAFLLLCLALYHLRGWFFREPEDGGT